MNAADCPVNGECIVRRVGDLPQFVQADMEIHATDWAADQVTFQAVYELGEWCPAVGAFHARRRFS